MSTMEDYAGFEFRVYSELNKKLDYKIDLTVDLFPYLEQRSGENGNWWILRWERRVYAGDRPDEIERLIRLKQKNFFADKIVKFTDKDKARSYFFKVSPVWRATVETPKIKRYKELPPYDLYLFQLDLPIRNMIMLDLKIVDLDKLTPDLSEQLLA